eukprot:TRINITY_DN749_c0_g1_i1.p1 TRINITY_DN749_c0_g1~~TRINITY_DN749_c0_g1_i1.p1  ORF type:complete len:117 (+),score=5.69 TRINITY_DN749_c0_g1_i1:69-419(+)
MTTIYHIISEETWKKVTDELRLPSLESEGFIHFSTRDQALWVANSFYKGQSKLVILVVDTAKLTSPLKFEGPIPPTPEKNDQLFPHLYGPLNADAVVRVVPFAPQEDGSFVLPHEL